MRRGWTILGAGFVLTLLVCVGAAAAESGTETASEGKYNVLMIVTDDLNTQLGAYGSKAVKSPSIDRLAARGTRFDMAIVQAPVCKASRMSFMMGRRVETTNVWDNRSRTPPETLAIESIPEFFHRHGYRTIGFGKVFGNDKMEAERWDHHEKLKGYAPDAPDKVTYADEKGVDYILPRPTLNDDSQEPDGRLARRAVELLEANRQGRFFMTVGFRNPHAPRAMPRKYLDLYPLESIRVPEQPPGDREDWPVGAAKAPPPNFAKLTSEQLASARQAYFASISFLDAQIGYLLDGLERLGLADKTVVVLMSDHGYGIGEHGLFGKGSHFLNVARVPLIIAVPGRKPAVVTHPVELVSVYATLADLCGLPQPQGVEGRSLAPLVGHPDRPWEHDAFLVSKKARSIFSDEYRYTEYGGKSERAELYDLEKDPGELVNLVDDPDHAKLRDELRARLHAGWNGERSAGG